MIHTTNISMNTPPSEWMGGEAKTVTISLTEECNLRCKYCYMTSKSSSNRMSLETAKKAVNFILKAGFKDKGIVWDFIGGDPLLEIDLIDELTDYITIEQFRCKPEWVGAHRFMITTNGLLYNSDKVQKYLHKNKGNVEIAITLDGNKIKHDLQRVFADGTGSYVKVIENVKLWVEQFPHASTKATFSHDDLPHLKDSIISIWDQGIHSVGANIVFEDVWQDGDDIIYEEQLNALADYVLENSLWESHYVTFFNPNFGFPNSEADLSRNHCGTGKMLAIDTKGNLFPCIRFLDFTLGEKKYEPCGDIFNGLNQDRLRPFQYLTARSQSSNECVECEVATGCAWCTGNNFNEASHPTIFERTVANCKMHKANVRAIERFWNLWNKRTGLLSPRLQIEQIKTITKRSGRFLYIIKDSNFLPHCNYKNININTDPNNMPESMFKQALELASDENFSPVILSSEGIELINTVPNRNENKTLKIPVNSYSNCFGHGLKNNSLISIRQADLSIFSRKGIPEGSWERLNLVLEDSHIWNDHDFELYAHGLQHIGNLIIENFKSGKNIEVNKLTDPIYYPNKECGAGISSFALAPNGKIYRCPAFYIHYPTEHIGHLSTIDLSKINLTTKPVPDALCSQCVVKKCQTCCFENRFNTGEFHIPSKNKCNISIAEHQEVIRLSAYLPKRN